MTDAFPLAIERILVYNRTNEGRSIAPESRERYAMKKMSKMAGGVLGSVCEIVVGILLLVNPTGFTAGIIIALGVLLAVLGVLGIVRYFRTEPVRAALEQQLIRGLLMLLLGLFCIFNARWFIATFPVLTMLYGVGLLVVGVAKVQWTVDILRVKVGRWYLPGISALVTLVCAAVILLNPFASTVALWVFIGVALIVEAMVDLLAILWDRLRGV